MMLDAWGRSAEARGIGVLALQCPRSEGCTSQSWWKWGRYPEWLVQQTRAFGALRPVDPDRKWIVGWSGGASYIGSWTQELEREFAAIVIHGGGMPPPRGACPATAKAGVYFLVGDANPLHYLATRLRDHYDACGNDVVWTLLAHADHDGERRALAGHREAILDWLSTRSLTHAAPTVATATAAQGDASAPSTPPPPSGPPTPSGSAPRAAHSPPPEHASCSASGMPAPRGGGWSFLVVVLAACASPGEGLAHLGFSVCPSGRFAKRPSRPWTGSSLGQGQPPNPVRW